MTSPDAILSAVADRLALLVRAMRAETEPYGDEAAQFIDAAERALHGGKRLRARFCHAGWRATAAVIDASAVETDAVWDLCAALEVFQAAALVHDDIIDNSDTRRGRPATHRALESVHAARDWHGDAEAFGRSAAVLLGDLLVAWSDDLLEQALDRHPHAGAVRQTYARMRRDVTTGQFLDIAEESAWSVSPRDEQADRALRVASLKSARYSVEQPLLLGAVFAGADAEQQDALRRFGHPLGMAFQLRDDVLGVFGDEQLTGKPAGDDLREGKRTALIAFASAASDDEGRSALDRLLGDAGLEAAQIAMLQSLIVSSGALDRVERMIADYAAAADRALLGARLEHEALSVLRDLARAATERTA